MGDAGLCLFTSSRSRSAWRRSSTAFSRFSVSRTQFATRRTMCPAFRFLRRKLRSLPRTQGRRLCFVLRMRRLCLAFKTHRLFFASCRPPHYLGAFGRLDLQLLFVSLVLPRLPTVATVRPAARHHPCALSVGSLLIMCAIVSRSSVSLARVSCITSCPSRSVMCPRRSALGGRFRSNSTTGPVASRSVRARRLQRLRPDTFLVSA